MGIIVYSEKSNPSISRFHRRVAGLAPEIRMASHHTFESLIQHLCFPERLHEETMVVLFVSDEDDLLVVESCREYFEDLKVILVLPSLDKTMISRAHMLRPRFIEYGSSDFKNVIAIIRKIHNRIYQGKKYYRKEVLSEPGNGCDQSNSKQCCSQGR